MKGFECSIDFPKPIGRKKMEKATAVLGNWMFLPKTAAGKGGTVEFNMTDLDKKKELKGDRKRNGEYMKASFFWTCLRSKANNSLSIKQHLFNLGLSFVLSLAFFGKQGEGKSSRALSFYCGPPQIVVTNHDHCSRGYTRPL